MIHKEQHPYAGKTVTVKLATNPLQSLQDGCYFKIEDWYDRIENRSWMDDIYNIACMMYAIRSGTSDTPIDNEVVYGHIEGLGYLIHVSEIDELVNKGEK